MKVCHLTSVHKPDDARIFHKECTSLANAGYDTYLVVCGGSYEKNGVHIIGTGEQSKSRLKRMRVDTKRIYRAALEIDADIYHIHDPELLPYAVKLKKKGKKVIFDSHELYPVMMSVKPYIPRFARSFVATLYKAYETRIVRKLDAVIFPCLINGKHPFEGRCKRTCFIDNFPILSTFEVFPEATADAVCYIGSLTYDRGITGIVKAAHIAGVKLVLAGTFAPPTYKDEIFAMPEADCIEYLGQIPQASVRSTVAKCKVGMCVLRNTAQYRITNNFSTKVLEYWTAHRPVIISNTRYNTTTMPSIEGGICVDPDNYQEIADAIRRLISNPDEASRMGENGNRAVLEKYSWAHEEKKLLELYEELFKQRT